MLIILSGPPAAGKTTIGEKLAQKFPRSAYFSLDTIRHFIKSGHLHPKDAGSQEQLKLATDISKDIIKRYTEKDYTMILDDVMFPDNLEEYKNEFKDVHAFLLLPSLEVLKQRDSQRAKEDQQGKRVEELFHEFMKSSKSDYIVIDSSNQTKASSVETILKNLRDRY